MFTLDDIMEAVSFATGITVREIRGRCREHRIITARHMYFFYAYEKTPCSYDKIGEFCGGRDHATVLYGRRKYMDTFYMTRDEKRIAKKIEDILYLEELNPHREMCAKLGEAYYYSKKLDHFKVGFNELI